MMKTVMLYTKDGEFVVNGLIPAFKSPPDVIVWGDRHFQYSATSNEDIDSYIECFAVALVFICARDLLGR